jgi:hypothetical protein
VGVPGFETSASGFPHSPQNLVFGAFSNPQLAHLSFSEAPQSPQNFMPLAFSKPQAGQRMDGPEAGSTVDRRATSIQATRCVASV